VKRGRARPAATLKVELAQMNGAHATIATPRRGIAAARKRPRSARKAASGDPTLRRAALVSRRKAEGEDPCALHPRGRRALEPEASFRVKRDKPRQSDSPRSSSFCSLLRIASQAIRCGRFIGRIGNAGYAKAEFSAECIGITCARRKNRGGRDVQRLLHRSLRFA